MREKFIITKDDEAYMNSIGKQSKVKKVMGEYKHGQLHSGSKTGPIVHNRKQAVAIAMSEARSNALKHKVGKGTSHFSNKTYDHDR